MAETGNKQQYLAQPLQIMIDIQLGPDGHPWIRMQVATVGMSTSIVFPQENAEDVIANITQGIREQVKRAGKKKVDLIMPDFTEIRPKV